tara:strand:- start:7366 stop:7749 length:384 start_codon:yes stop_codon:yes gene_type:complete
MKTETENIILDRNNTIAKKGDNFCYVMEDIDDLVGAIIVEIDEVFEDNIFTTIEYGSRNFCGREGYVMCKARYVYKESDDDSAEFEFAFLGQVAGFIARHNEYFETNYKSIRDFNKGEEYRKILIKN